MSKRKQPIEKLETTYTVERWCEPGGYWDRQLQYQNKGHAVAVMKRAKELNSGANYRVRKTVETVVAAA